MHEGSNVHLTSVHLLGLNTPQFDHCRSKMPSTPTLVPPIYQPEVGRRRSTGPHYRSGASSAVGVSTGYRILGDRSRPGSPTVPREDGR